MRIAVAASLYFANTREMKGHAGWQSQASRLRLAHTREIKKALQLFFDVLAGLHLAYMREMKVGDIKEPVSLHLAHVRGNEKQSSPPWKLYFPKGAFFSVSFLLLVSLFPLSSDT